MKKSKINNVVARSIDKTVNIDNIVNYLEAYILNNDCNKIIFLDNCTKIIDLRLFISSHIKVVKSNNNKIMVEPYLVRLKKLVEILDQK